LEPRQGSGIYVRQPPPPLITRALTISVAPQEEQPVHAFYDLRELIETRTAYDAARLRTPAQLAAIANDRHRERAQHRHLQCRRRVLRAAQ
jgi:DNA-binding FadR family transcriptional regulator